MIYAYTTAATGFDDLFIYEELQKRPTARRIPVTQILREECRFRRVEDRDAR